MEEKKIVAQPVDYRQRIRKQAGRLADLLRQSPEYRQLIDAKKKVGSR